MKKQIILPVLILITIIYISLNASSALEIQDSDRVIEAYRNHSLVRLHVLANSDLPRDQYIKRQVRDQLQKYLNNNTLTFTADQKISGDDQDQIENIVSSVLRENNAGYSQQVLYGNYDFSARNYNGLTLPAGEYRALKIILGRGDGANWWCVLMPPFDRDRNHLGNDIVIRSRLIEYLQNNGYEFTVRDNPLHFIREKVLRTGIHYLSSLTANDIQPETE